MVKGMEQKKRKIILGSCAALVVLFLIVILLNMNSDGRRLNELLDLGEKYLDDMAYEDAILVFDQAITIDPKCEEAYMGKAEAQYALGQYEAAVDTLRAGIENVEDSTRLEEFLQQILDAMAEMEAAEQNVVETEEVMEAPLRLNYTDIVRRTDTEEPEVQLEVLDDTGEGNYIWESSNPECVTVSETGLVTCLSVEGRGYVSVEDENGRKDSCRFDIVNPESNRGESENFWIFGENEEEGQKTCFNIHLAEEEGQKKAEIKNVFGKYIYYSGDVAIPEKFNYKNEEISITSISSDAFYWSNELESIFIPDTIESVGNSGSPFGGLLGLGTINVDDGNEFLKSVDGVLYSKDGKALISYPAAKKGSVYTIPKDVEKIYQDAFKGCKNLEEILVENGNGFYDSIDGVLIDKNQQLMIYPAGKKASKYVIPDNITGIYQNAFYMSELEEIVFNGIEYIEAEWLFAGSSKLKRIEGGSETKSIAINTKVLGNDGIVEISGLESMENLEQLILQFDAEYDAAEIIDLEQISKLGNLKHLEISRINDLSDISWLESLQTLGSIHLVANNITITDFLSLFDLPNLRYMFIENFSENAELKKWFEEMAEKYPDMDIYYNEYSEEFEEDF